MVADVQGTREKLLHAAISIADTQGIDQIRIRDIASAVGVKQPSVYHFFGSREGLIIEVEVERFSRGLNETAQLFDAGVRGCTTSDEFVKICQKVMTAIGMPERISIRSVRAEVWGAAQSRPELALRILKSHKNLDEALASTLHYAQEQGWIRPDLDTLAMGNFLNTTVSSRYIVDMAPDTYNSTLWDEIALNSFLANFGYVNGKPAW